jgi:MFS family permease
VSALRRRYLTGAFLMALGFTASGLAPSVAAAVVTFLAAGYGNGMLLIYERLLIQALVPDQLSGRIFGIRDAITAWAFALGFLAGPLLLDVVGRHAGNGDHRRGVRPDRLGHNRRRAAAVRTGGSPVCDASSRCWR